MAIKRSMDELNTRVQSRDQGAVYGLHPAVEWRFRQAARNCATPQSGKSWRRLEPIVFDGSNPLYASPIFGLFNTPNTAIQADLVEHLRLAQEVLRFGYGTKPLPILDELAYHVGQTHGAP